MRRKKSKSKVTKASRKLSKAFVTFLTNKKCLKKLKKKFVEIFVILVLVPTPILATWIGLNEDNPKTPIMGVKVIIADTIFYSETSD